jgi:hypothetical protein
MDRDKPGKNRFATSMPNQPWIFHGWLWARAKTGDQIDNEQSGFGYAFKEFL